MTDIIIEHLIKRFDGKTVLNDISVIFPAGKATCIMGPSGCGKTTLLNILMGFVKPDGGTIRGIPERFSVVFQEDRLCETLKTAANIRMVTGDSVSREQVYAHFRSLGIEDTLDKRVSELSGGMKRRVAIARALLAGGELLILDEPFNGLDPAMREQTAAVILASGKTILMVSHDAEEARLMGANIYLMKRGNEE